MKINRKPDLMLLLALFVLIGVVVSTLSYSEREANSDTFQGQDDATVPIRTQNNDVQKLHRGNYMRVSSESNQSIIFG